MRLCYSTVITFKIQKIITMKSFIAFACLIASISAVPRYGVAVDYNDERIVTGQIISAIDDLSQSIKDAGLDPLYIKREDSSYALPVPVIFNYAAFVEEILSTGLSNIKVNRINYGVLTSRLTFDIEIPRVEFAVGASAAKATIFSNDIEGLVSGTVVIDRIRVTGNVRVSIGIISGISIRSVDIDFSLRGIESNVRLVIQGNNYSEQINEFLGATIPDTLKSHSKEINKLLEIVVLEVLNDNL
ncbi:uncharacterized protein LOC113492930 isoform X2 [Trichoplusia ni]|uniref:Uncharacterized protein LOC113492930 isoform X2 n=1 Tax=Trichoplusia ni TaxID=7111 RepID=A0A7E5VDT8_TRINI|nr:uncharacterized protein LOC113492930 isoform X2 [Trichoplusia ni]